VWSVLEELDNCPKLLKQRHRLVGLFWSNRQCCQIDQNNGIGWLVCFTEVGKVADFGKTAASAELLETIFSSGAFLAKMGDC
jgi:hypothetical protein